MAMSTIRINSISVYAPCLQGELEQEISSLAQSSMALQGAAGELGDSGQAIQHLAQQKEGEISGHTCRRQGCCELCSLIAAIEWSVLRSTKPGTGTTCSMHPGSICRCWGHSELGKSIFAGLAAAYRP